MEGSGRDLFEDNVHAKSVRTAVLWTESRPRRIRSSHHLTTRFGNVGTSGGILWQLLQTYTGTVVRAESAYVDMKSGWWKWWYA